MKNYITEQQLNELEVAYLNSNNERVKARLKAVILRGKGCKLSEIAAQTNFHVSSISRILSLYRNNGLPALVENHYLGNRRNMSFEEEAAFLQSFQDRIDAGQTVLPKDIKAAYEQIIGHTIGGSQIYYVMKRHGWRAAWLSGRKSAPESDSD